MEESLETTEQAEQAKKAEKKKKWFGKFEIIVAILLAITTLCTAWASWISALHGSDMSSNYALSARQTAEATSTYNAAYQTWVNAYNAWSYAYEKYKDIQYEKQQGQTELAAHDQEVLDNYLSVNLDGYEFFKDAIYEALNKGISPFEQYDEEYFFKESNEKFQTATDTRTSADWNNLCSDCFGLVQVLYSIVLFLLGIVGVYRVPRARQIIFTLAIVLFVGASVYMFTLPLPVNFDFANYFSVIHG